MGPKQSLSMDLMIRETLCRGNCHPRAFVGHLQSPSGFSTQSRGGAVLTGRSELTVFTHFRTCEGWNGSRAQMVCWHTFCHLIHLASLHTEMHWQRGEMLGCYWFKKRNAFEQLLYRELGTREREWRSVSVTQRQRHAASELTKASTEPMYLSPVEMDTAYLPVTETSSSELVLLLSILLHRIHRYKQPTIIPFSAYELLSTVRKLVLNPSRALSMGC